MVLFISVLESFGILMFQTIQRNGFNFKAFIKDDNIHYLVLGASLLSIRPNVLLTIIPYILFSSFHVLAYINGYLLPLFGFNKSVVSKLINAFINQNNTKSIQLASGIELITYFWMILRLITARPRSIFPVIVYTIFLKIRYEVSPFTRGYVSHVANSIESLVKLIENPILNKVWSHTKHAFKVIGMVKLVNDYTKVAIKTE